MPDSEKDKMGGPGTLDGSAAPGSRGAAEKAASGEKVTEESATAQYFFGEPLVGFDPNEISGQLVVIEGMDGSLDADRAAAGVAGVRRIFRADERAAALEPGGTRH